MNNGNAIAQRLTSEITKTIGVLLDDVITQYVSENPDLLLELIVRRDPRFQSLEREVNRLERALAIRHNYPVGLNLDIDPVSDIDSTSACTESDDEAFADEAFVGRMNEVLSEKDSVEVCELLPPFETDLPMMYYTDRTEPQYQGKIYDMTAEGDIGECVGHFDSTGAPVFTSD